MGNQKKKIWTEIARDCTNEKNRFVQKYNETSLPQRFLGYSSFIFHLREWERLKIVFLSLLKQVVRLR